MHIIEQYTVYQWGTLVLQSSFVSSYKNSSLLLEILKNRISNLEKELIEKDAIINFLLKQKGETNNNTSLVNKTVTENDEILEIERRNSSPSSNSKQKRENEAEP